MQSGVVPCLCPLSNGLDSLCLTLPPWAVVAALDCGLQEGEQEAQATQASHERRSFSGSERHWFCWPLLDTARVAQGSGAGGWVTGKLDLTEVLG